MKDAALHVGIDAIGLFPEGEVVSRAIGNAVGFRGIVAIQQGGKVIDATKAAVGIGSTGAFGADASPEGLGSTALGVAGIAATVGGAIPVVGQILSGASIVLDFHSAWNALDACK